MIRTETIKEANENEILSLFVATTKHTTAETVKLTNAAQLHALAP